MKIKLHVPNFEELAYRETLLSDPQTMSYNRGYDINSENYDRNTGCISFPRSEWKDWYDYFIGKETDRFYAYIECDGTFIGEVNLHRSMTEANTYDMGIVVEARHRAKGISEPALKKLLAVAFEKLGAEAVNNEFEATREAALKSHKAVGFEEVAEKDGIVKLTISKERYLSNKSD